jgi:hypothetical protein
MPSKACAWDFLNHFPLPLLYRYGFTTLLAGAQELFTQPVSAMGLATYTEISSLNKMKTD